MTSKREIVQIAQQLEAGTLPLRDLELEEWPQVLRGRGRPNLTGGAGQSPRLTIRLDSDLLARAREVAEREHVTVAELTRQALAERVGAAGS